MDWHRFHSRNWLTGTSQLDAEERGMFITICALIYDKRSPIDDDDPWLAGVLKTNSRKVKRLKFALVDKGKITIADGKIHQEKCAEEIAWSERYARTQSDIGSMGGRPPKSSRTAVERDCNGVATRLNRSSKGPVSNNINDIEKPTDTDTDITTTGPGGIAQEDGQPSAQETLFSMAPTIAQKAGVPEARARSVLGELTSVTDFDDAISTARTSLGKTNPVTWLGACIKRRRGTSGPTSMPPNAPSAPDPDDPRTY